MDPSEPTSARSAKGTAVDAAPEVPGEVAGAGAAPPEESDGKVDWGRYGRGPVLLLAGVGLVDAIDKGILPGVLTSVQDELGFSDFQLGMLEFAFVIATFLVIVPAGYLADRGNRTRIIAVVLASWAAISALTATVRGFAGFFGVRAALGVGETIDDPASQSLIADYYPARIRGRAYSYARVTPTLGRALGTIFGGIVAATLGWRAAFLLVGIPGSILAVFVWRMKEPIRGEADMLDLGAAPAAEAEAAATDDDAQVDPDRIGVKEILADIPRIVRIPSLRALLVGFAVASGALSGIGFWAVAFNERHSDLTGGAAATVTGLMILSGAIGGTLLGGRIADRVRASSPGAPMAAAGIGYVIGGLFLLVGFFDVPVYTVRLPAHTLGVAFIVGGFPATYAMISEVVSSDVRGQAFAASRFLSALIGAFSPPLIGLLADQFQIEVRGEMVGNLALAFGLFIPMLFIGAWYLYRGRVFVEADIAAARTQTLAYYGITETGAADPDDEDPDDDGPEGGSPFGPGGPGGSGGPTGSPTGGPTSPLASSSVEIATLPSASGSAPPSVSPGGATSPSAAVSRMTAGLQGLSDRRSSTRPRRSREERMLTTLLWSGGGIAVAGAATVILGWVGAAHEPQAFDQVPYAISGGLLGVAMLGVGATMVVVSQFLRSTTLRQRRDGERLAEAVEGLRTSLLGDDRS